MGKGKFLGEFEQLVLLAVVHGQGDAYGMSVRRLIETRTGRAVSIGAVYATLDRLHDKGYVDVREGDATSVRGGRAKRLFKLRPEGADALHESRQVLDRMWTGLESDPSGWVP